MSTLKVGTLQDTSAANSSTPAQINSGRAKVWIEFTGQGSAAIVADYGVSSVARRSNGNYTVTFDSSFANTNYIVSCTTGVNFDSWVDGQDSPDQTSVCLNKYTGYVYVGAGDMDDGAPDDVDRMCVVIWAA
tara:strand:+ start:1148 stop:1543 length:396 start_codon:yes stop_codon:yes gene_type:complete